MLFAAETGLKADFKIVDLLTGEHLQPAYAALNPSCMVPMLEDGDFRLTESSAILKYLAEKTGSPAYPADLRKRAKINEMMDWLNTQFYRDYGYGLIYPNITRWLGNMKGRPSWTKVNQAFYDLAGSLKDAPFEAI